MNEPVIGEARAVPLDRDQLPRHSAAVEIDLCLTRIKARWGPARDGEVSCHSPRGPPWPPLVPLPTNRCCVPA